MSRDVVLSGRRNRWAVSFADLLMLLLGFFVLLQASGSRRDAMLAQVSRQFGVGGGRAVARSEAIRASDLFEPGEALLTPAGQLRLQRLGRSIGGRHAELRSTGFDPVRQRFDRWDLAAARLGAVARALRAGGVDDDRLMIRGLDQSGEGADAAQSILVTWRN